MRNEIDSSKCIVAFIDMLGIKEFVKGNNSRLILDKFKRIQSIRNEIEKDKIICFEENDKSIEKEYNKISDSIYFRIMSDSIVIATDIFSKEALIYIVKWISSIQAYLLSVDNELLVRGGISFGEFYGDNEIMFGKGMVLAYELENKAITPRVIIEDCLISEMCNDFNFKEESAYIKQDTDKYYYVDYLLDIDWYKNRDKVMRFVSDGLKLAEKLQKKYSWVNEKMEHQIDLLNAKIEADEFRKNNF